MMKCFIAALIALALQGCTIGEIKSFVEANVTMDLARAIQQNHQTRNIVDRAEGEIIGSIADYLKSCVNGTCTADEMQARVDAASRGLVFLKDHKPPLYSLRLLDEPEIRRLLGDDASSVVE